LDTVTARVATPLPLDCQLPPTRKAEEAASAQDGLSGEPVATRSFSRTVVAHAPLPSSSRSSPLAASTDALHAAAEDEGGDDELHDGTSSEVAAARTVHAARVFMGHRHRILIWSVPGDVRAWVAVGLFARVSSTA
jgi:hypothetical protein